MMLISFSIKADELVESQSLAQAISELASAIKEHTLDEQTSRKQSVPASRRLQTFPVAPLSDSQKNKPQHQFVTVLKSTIPEIPEGSVFKSNTHGITFFFNGYWLALGAVTDYFPNDFGEIMENDSYQWTLSNFIEGITPYTGGSSRNDRRTNFRTYSGTTIEVWETDCMSERSPANEPMVYPLRLTNDLHVIEFAAPQELAVPQATNKLASATNDQTSDQRTSTRLGLSRERISGGLSLPPGVSLPRSIQHVDSERRVEHVKYVEPSKDYQKDKPQYQSVTVLKSTIPEIPERSVLKSNTHGLVFFFNGCWLVLSSVTDYVLNEFGETLVKDSHQWILSNFIDGITPNTGGSGTIGRMTKYRTFSGTSIDVWETDCISERYPVNEPMIYPLRLTNDLYFIEFAAPQELAVHQKEN